MQYVICIKCIYKDKEWDLHPVGFHSGYPSKSNCRYSKCAALLSTAPAQGRWRRGRATWLVLVGMTDQTSSNHIRLWRSSWLPPPPLLYIHNGCSCCLFSPSERVKVVSGAPLVLLSSGEGHAGYDPSSLIREVHSQLRHISVLLVWR